MQKYFVGATNVIVNGEESIKLKYYLIKEMKEFEETKRAITTYGVEIDKNNIEREMIKDISVNESEVNKVINMLISNQVTPIHLYDVIEDFL